MSFDRLCVGVIGLGYFGERHARIYRDLPDAELVAVCDRNGARTNEIAESLGVEAVPDASALLARADIDAVSICAPASGSSRTIRRPSPPSRCWMP